MLFLANEDPGKDITLYSESRSLKHSPTSPLLPLPISCPARADGIPVPRSQLPGWFRLGGYGHL